MPLFLLFSLPAWNHLSLPNSPHGSRPSSKSHAPQKNTFQVILVHFVLCPWLVLYLWPYWNFILHHLLLIFLSCLLLGCVGASKQICLWGLSRYTIWLTPDQHQCYSGSPCDTMKNTIPASWSGFTCQDTLWNQDPGRTLQAWVQKLLGVSSSIHMWHKGLQSARGKMGTEVHTGSIWDWGPLLRWYCKPWSMPESGEEPRKFWERCFLPSRPT